MPLMPCLNRTTCPPDSPISNWSSEGIEPPPPWQVINFPTPNPNPLPNGDGPWKAKGCLGVCTSTISAMDASLCAIAQTSQCQNPNPTPNACPLPPCPSPTPPAPGGGGQPGFPGPGGGGVGIGGDCTRSPCPWPNNTNVPPPAQPSMYCNDEITLHIPCPDPASTAFNYVFPAGVICSTSLVRANTVALMMANAWALANRICLGPLPSVVCAHMPYPDNNILPTMPPGTKWQIFDVGSTSIPPGLTVDPQTGSVVGTPDMAGDYHFGIQAKTPSGFVATRTYEICVVDVLVKNKDNPFMLPDGCAHMPYHTTVAGPLCGNVQGGYEIYAAFDKALGINWTVDQYGNISGTCPDVGDYKVDVTIVPLNEFGDIVGNPCSKTLNLHVEPCLQDQSPLPDGYYQDPYSYTFRACSTDGSAPCPPVTWSLVPGSEIPLGLTLDPATGVLSGIAEQAGQFDFVVQICFDTGNCPAYGQTVGTDEPVPPTQ
jgi:Putative Ig domain